MKRLFGIAAITLAAFAAGMVGTSQADDQLVRLTLQPSADACTAWDQMNCSYLEVRNGNAPAPDPENDPEPTFLNMAALPGPVTVDASISDTGEVTIAPDSVRFPAFPTSLENALVGTVAIGIQISASSAWSGTYDDLTGAMELEAPLGLTFKLNCDPVANATCGAIFGSEGNMGTWEVTPKGPVDPLTTGNLPGPTPPVGYGPDWQGPLAEDGSPFDANGVGTLINNDLEIENLDASACIDPGSIACSNPAIANLIAPSLNGALGTVYDPANPANDRDSVPGAIDMRLTFVMSAPPILEASPSQLAFAGMNDDGSQPLGTSSPPQATTITALDAGDIEVRAIYTSGGNDDDFFVTDARSCGPTIESGGECQVRLRFNPGATGSRTSTLYASILNPVTSGVEQVQLATLSGEGGTLPQGPTGPTGPEGPPGPSGPQGQNGALVSISTAGSVALRTGARKFATVATRGGAVRLRAPNRANIRVRGKRYTVRIAAPNRVGQNRRAALRVRGPRGAVNALRGRATARLKVPVTVTSGNRSQRQVLQVTLK